MACGKKDCELKQSDVNWFTTLRKSRNASKEDQAMSEDHSPSVQEISPETIKEGSDIHTEGAFLHFSRSDKVKLYNKTELWGWWCNTMQEACQYSTGGIEGYIGWPPQSSVVGYCDAFHPYHVVKHSGPIIPGKTP